jgi:hypothetical protein
MKDPLTLLVTPGDGGIGQVVSPPFIELAKDRILSKQLL